jgi:hypothetical protein
MKTCLNLLFVFLSILLISNFVCLKRSPEKESINSLGAKVKGQSLLTEFPFLIQSCDQIVAFKGQLIPDDEDYTKRQEAFFTITAYYVNAFNDASADTLLQSLTLSEMTTLPKDLRGARGCISLNGAKSGHPLLICLSNTKESDNILAVLKHFSDCRGNLINKGKEEKPEIQKIKKMLRGCGLGGKFINAETLKKKLAEVKKANENKKDLLASSTSFFKPGGEKVPGS